jgi:simple sugar transport system substrate-binding protein
MPDDVKKAAQETEAAIIAGTLHPFKGPITKQDGSELVPAGQNVDDGTLLGMNFYVKGIDDQIPQ